MNNYHECIESAIDNCLDVKILDFQIPEIGFDPRDPETSQIGVVRDIGI